MTHRPSSENAKPGRTTDATSPDARPAPAPASEKGRVIVIGSGITGIACALRLRSAGVRCLVLEAAPRAGGAMQTTREDGWVAELGPNTVLTSRPELSNVLEGLGLTDRVLRAGTAGKKRYVVRRGRPVAIPGGPGSLLTTRLLGPLGKIRLLREAFVSKRREPGGACERPDESIADFAERRFGREAHRYLIDPFVAGVFAGRTDRLSVRHAFPKLTDMEAEHGSVIRGFVRAAKQRRAEGSVRPAMISFEGGLATIGDAFAARAGAPSSGERVCDVHDPGLELRTNQRVTAISPSPVGGLRVRTESGERFDGAGVAWAASTDALGRVALQDEASEPRDELATLPASPIAVVHLGFRREDVEHPLDGFGVLAPTVERRRCLGILFPSSIFPGRAPDGHVLLTAFLGGAREPGGTNESHDERRERAIHEARSLLGVRAEPVWTHEIVWPRAIPQYELGHDTYLDHAAAIERRIPGLVLGGNWRGGISVPDSAAGGERLALRLLDLGSECDGTHRDVPTTEERQPETQR